MADERESHMRGEGGAPADRHAIRYYQKIWAEGGLMGKPERVNGAGFVMACPGRSSDVIHMYVWIEAGNIQEARWQCHMCDPWMQVAGDILCHLVRGSPLSEVLQRRWDDFARVLGGHSALIMEHAGAAMLTMHKAVIDYQVRACFMSQQDSEVAIEPTQKLRELGLVGREGQQHLRHRLEGAFSAFALQIPHVKVQEWVAMGTVQDVSLTVQALVEHHVIQRILGQGCGFPRSFEEQLAARG
jgi:NifU-like protein involved in Fe-S cluster formation